MALFGQIFGPCVLPDEIFDYGLFIPGEEFRPYPVSDDEFSFQEERKKKAPKAPAPPPPVIVEVPKDQLQDAFDKHSGNKKAMTVDQTALFVRHLGLAPSQKDLQLLGNAKGNAVTLQDAKDFMQTISHSEDDYDVLTGFFRLYDPSNSGKLTKKQMKNLMQNMGEPLTDKELDAFYVKCGASSDPVDYETIVKMLLAK